jgi:Bacterial SH3 domain
MTRWQPFIAALTELYEFAVESVRFKHEGDSHVSEWSEMSSSVSTKAAQEPASSAHSVPGALSRSLLTHTTAYIVSDETKVFARPVWAFDTVIGTLSYGTVVDILGFQGRFAQIAHQALTGWVHKDAVTERKEALWPELRQGVVYEAETKETVLVRKLLQDEFFAAELYLPLQMQEFVGYALLTRNHTLPTTSVRPRSPGLWHEIYKGAPGIIIGLEPKTGSILEAFPSGREPFIGFVTAVHVDASIVVETVGKDAEGCFKSEVYTKTDWQSWRPVFIQCT